MDHQAFAQLLGNYGEFLGAIAVVVTLGYLAAQIRQNTRSLDENRKVALAQTYQMRAGIIMDVFMRFSDPDFAAANLKYRRERSENGVVAAIAALTPEERARFSAYLKVTRTYTDNTFYQYQLGLLDEEYASWGLGPHGSLGENAQDWRDWGIPIGRESFEREVDRYLGQREQQS